MKNKILLIILSLVFSLQACEDHFGDVNVNPNSPVKVPPGTLLPSVESILNYAVWGDLSRFSSIYTGQVDGVDRQFAAFQEYIFRGNDVDAYWNNMYANGLTNIQELRKSAGDPSVNSAYHGVANVLEAYTILTLTDYFGDIPYSEAVNAKGDGNLQPIFDSQESVYSAAIELLNKSLALLDGPNALKPGADDIVYKGDLAKWKKFANATLARAYLHLSKRDQSNYAKALSAANASFTSFDDEPKFNYEASKGSPWHQFNDQRAGSFEPGDSYIELMNSLEDPRVAIFGTTLNASHPFLTVTAAMPFISYTEIQFIKAECALKTNDANAQTMYADAVKTSFDQLGLTSDYDAYFNANGVNTVSLENIITQKYIANFLSSENFNDWRRTGLPDLKPNTGTEIPRRFPYPQTETDYNVNCPKPDQVTIFSRVWWDI